MEDNSLVNGVDYHYSSLDDYIPSIYKDCFKEGDSAIVLVNSSILEGLRNSVDNVKAVTVFPSILKMYYSGVLDIYSSSVGEPLDFVTFIRDFKESSVNGGLVSNGVTLESSNTPVQLVLYFSNKENASALVETIIKDKNFIKEED